MYRSPPLHTSYLIPLVSLLYLGIVFAVAIGLHWLELPTGIIIAGILLTIVICLKPVLHLFRRLHPERPEV